MFPEAIQPHDTPKMPHFFRNSRHLFRYPNPMARASDANPNTAAVLDEGDRLDLRVWTGTSTGMPVAHMHSDLELNYVLQGRMTYLMGGSLVTLPRRRLCVLWAGTPHQTVVRRGPAPKLTWATVPLGEAWSWELPASLTRPLLERGLVIDPAPRDTDEAMLQQWQRDLAGATAADRRIVLLELEARLRRMAASLSEQSADQPAIHAAPRPPEALRAVEQMAQYIAAHYHEPIQAADIARAAHLHPNYAMTLFRRQTGLTLNTYLTQQRIAHAQRLLATTQRPILQIALDAGFGSVSRFFEAFKQRTGQSPRRFRQQLANK